MKITSVSYERLDLTFSAPYTIAYETITKATNFILKIETDTSIVGYSCAAPDKIVTGETVTEAEDAIKDIIIPYLIGKNPFTYARVLEELKAKLEGKRSALAMVDIALYDLMSKKARVPLFQFLGGYRSSITTSITIGILPPKETLKQAVEYVNDGFSVLKIKGGLHLEDDIEKMVCLREKFPNIKLRFDGNQGYSVEDAIAFVKSTNDIGIEIFEQPIKILQKEKLEQIIEGINIPIMADESLKTLTDAFRLARNEFIDLINIKLMKVGGILEAMHINSVAKSANSEVMIGCIDECALGISAGLHFALSRPNIYHADLDGHLDMTDDPFKGLFILKKGVLYPTDSPGLGKIDL